MNANLPCLVAEPDSGNGEVWLVYHWVACRGSTQAMFIQPLVTLPAALISLSQALRYLTVHRPIWSKRGRPCHLRVPILRPDAVGVAQARRPGKHRFAKLDTDGITEEVQYSSGIFQHVCCI